MTIEEVSAILERVLDLTNEEGKREIHRVLSEMAGWTASRGYWLKEYPELKDKPEETLPLKPEDRREEERDPGENEQKEAADLKLPVLK